MSKAERPDFTIVRACSDVTVRFAASELARYLRRGAGKRFAVRSRSRAAQAADFAVGLATDLNLKPPRRASATDDWILIRPSGKGMMLSGSNPRSVLFAVYRYLHELGFRWIRPGKRGEIIPSLRNPIRTEIRISDAPSYRHRHFCIEGAASFEHARDLIDWAAKHGMSGYFIQFQTGHEFFRRWYEHENNPLWPGAKSRFTIKQAEQLADRLAVEAGKRGLELGRMGHAWTCAALGIDGEGWSRSDPALSRQKKQWLASVNGKRGFFGGVPLNTNLCTSKRDVREAIAEQCLIYAKKHPESTLLRFCLADGESNSCDCAACRRKRPADWLVDILNLIDMKLTKAEIDTRFAFPVYADLLWPPVRSRINNPDRFPYMFAPITRSYSVSYQDAVGKPARVAPFRLNDYEMPKDVPRNLAYLRAWQRVYPGESYIFDYHLWCACYFDMAQVNLARILRDDIATYTKLGLHGLDSCANQRMSFPHNLLLDTTAATLWNRRRSFNDTARTSFSDAYGSDASKAQAFFTEMSRLWSPFFDAVYIPSHDVKRIQSGLRNIPRMKRLCTAFQPVIRRNLKRTRGAVKWSWRYADVFVKWMDVLLPAYEAYLRCDPDVGDRFEAAFDFVRQRERTLHPALDVFGVIKTMRWRIHEATVDSRQTLTG